MKKINLIIHKPLRTVAWIIVIISVILGSFLLYQQYNIYKNPEILVKWKTGSELDTVGFNILKSTNSSRDYLQLNSTMIPAALDPLGGNEYEYIDRDVEPDIKYFYKLEAISIDGNADIYGPIESETEKLSVLGLAPAFLSFLIAFITMFTLLKNDNVQKKSTRITIVEYH